MVGKKQVYRIHDGPTPHNFMFSLLRPGKDLKVLRFVVGPLHDTVPGVEEGDLDVIVTAISHCDSRGDRWEMEGFTDVQGEEVQVSISYLPEFREGQMVFGEEAQTQGATEMSDDAMRVRALMLIIQRMMAFVRTYSLGGLPHDLCVLVERAEKIAFAKDLKTLLCALDDANRL